mmetsp:Transcript_39343/g.121682  ORF Transcript_39343/g.121682 Transcript_39343/m.121682 type:complete len:221 (-) Transcript_39343:86-748(-)
MAVARWAVYSRTTASPTQSLHLEGRLPRADVTMKSSSASHAATSTLFSAATLGDAFRGDTCGTFSRMNDSSASAFRGPGGSPRLATTVGPPAPRDVAVPVPLKLPDRRLALVFVASKLVAMPLLLANDEFSPGESLPPARRPKRAEPNVVVSASAADVAAIGTGSVDNDGPSPRRPPDVRLGFPGVVATAVAIWCIEMGCRFVFLLEVLLFAPQRSYRSG